MLQDSRSSCNRGSPPTGVPSAPAPNPAVNIRTMDLQAAGSGILNRSPSAPALPPSSMQFAGGDSFNTSRTLRDLYTASTNFQSAQTFLQQRQSGVHSAAANSAFNNVRLSNPNSSNTNHSHNHNSNSSSNNNPAMVMSGGGPTNPNQQVLKCPRCDSLNTKFCYYNNYSLLQPRHFCKNCRRYWTKGGALRNVPVGGGCRKNKRSSSSSTSSPSGSSTAASHSSSIANIGSSNRSISSSTNTIISNGIAAISSGSQISAKRHLYIPEHQNPSNSYLLNNSTASSVSSLFNPAMNSVLLASAQDYATSMAGSGTNLSNPGAGGTFSSLAINNSTNLYHRLSLFGDPKLCMQQRQPTFISPKPFNSAIAAAAAGQLNHTDALNLSSYNGFNASPTLQSSLLDQIRRRSPQLNLPTQTYGMLQSSNDSFTDGSRTVTDVTNPNPNSCNLPSSFGSGKIAFSFNVGNSKHMSAAGITSDGQASVSCSSSSSSTSNPVQDFGSFGALNLTTADLTGFAGASSTGLDRLMNPSSASTLGPAGSCRDQSLQGSGFGQLSDYHTDDITTHDQVRLDPFIHGDLSENETANAAAAASNLMSQNQLIQTNAEDELESLQGEPQHINRSGNDNNDHVCAGASDAEQAAAAANSIVINGDDDDDQNVWSHAATAGSAQDGFLAPSTDSSSFWNTSVPSAWPDHHHLQCAGYGSSTT